MTTVGRIFSSVARGTRVARALSTLTPSASPIGVVMLNMGGPSSLDGAEDGVAPFLTRLFSDGEIIRLGPLQKTLGPFIARNRAPRIRAQYASIGGRSPIGDWTALQGAAMVAKLSAAHPQQAAAGGFRAYSAFRYAPPLTDAALRAMAADGVKRAIAFPQYPQFSCTTTGSSLNHLWRELLRCVLKAGAWMDTRISHRPSHPSPYCHAACAWRKPSRGPSSTVGTHTPRT